jgi:HPt (histidine-containing phosphotransfer) domain-containing protein
VSRDQDDELDYEAIDAEIEAVFAQVKNEYRRALPERLSELIRAITQARAQSDQLAPLNHALDEAHRMKGTLGSYGFVELARSVASVEMLLRQTKDKASQGTQLSSLWNETGPQVEKILVEALTTAERLSNSASNI